MKYGLVLEGGGARGAYHIGAVKALIENGIEIGAVTGTSIGALNAAFIAEGNFEEAYRLWNTISFNDLFDVENEKIKNAMDVNLDLNTVKYLSRKLSRAVKEKGIDTLKIRNLLEEKISEEKLRESDVKLGVVVYCISDAKGEELLIDDMEKGKLIDYLMASSNLPVFQRVRFDDKSYLDGGVYDNCPVNLIRKAGYKEAYVVRTFKRMRIRDYKNIVKKGDIKMHMIEPVDNLPSILNFDTKNLQEQVTLGYYDGLKVVKKLDGIRYYINSVKNKTIIERIKKMDYATLEKIISLANIKMKVGENVTEFFLQKVLPKLSTRTKNKNLTKEKEYVISLIEHIDLKNNVERFKIYTFDELLNEAKKYTDKKNLDAIELFIKEL